MVACVSAQKQFTLLMSALPLNSNRLYRIEKQKSNEDGCPWYLSVQFILILMTPGKDWHLQYIIHIQIKSE